MSTTGCKNTCNDRNLSYVTWILYPVKDRQPMLYIVHSSDGRELGQPPNKRQASKCSRTPSNRAKVSRGSPANREQQQSIRLATNAWTRVRVDWWVR